MHATTPEKYVADTVAVDPTFVTSFLALGENIYSWRLVPFSQIFSKGAFD